VSKTPILVAGTSYYGAITEFVGAAAPVVTPQAMAVRSGQLGLTPGTSSPVSILTTILPYYSVARNDYSYSYYAQLQAGGGSGSYTWTATTASNTVLTNAGLSLSSAGLISGTPTESGPLSISVTVADANNSSNTASATLTLNSADQMASSPGANDSQLKGTYTFLMSVMRNSASAAGSAPMQFTIGEATFDGAGNLSGEMDFNLDAGHFGPVPMTGYYSIGANNIGLMVTQLQMTGTGATNVAFSAGNLNGSSIYQNLQMIEFDNTNSTSTNGNKEIAAGFGKLQTSTTLATGSWVFGFNGETPCSITGSASCTAGLTTPYGPLSAAGVFTVNGSGGVSGGEEDASGVCPQGASSCAAYNYNVSLGVSTYTSTDSSGRGTVTLTYTGTLYPDAPTDFVYYVISPTEMVMMSTDSHVTYSLLGGDVVLQQGTISNSTFTNGSNFVVYAQAAKGSDGISTYPTQNKINLLLFKVTNPDNTNCSGGPSLSGTGYQNSGGQYGSGATAVMCFNVASNGRMTMPSAGLNGPVGYVASSSLALLNSQVPNAGSDPGLYRSEAQTATAFTGCDLFYGTLPPPTPMTTTVGYISSSSCPTSTYSSAGYQSGSGGPLQSGTGTLNIGAPNSSGVITGVTDAQGNNITIVVISATRGLSLDANQGDLTPYLSIIQQ
jgi:hypothetical protein